MEGKQMENEKNNSMHDRLVNPYLCVERDNNLLDKEESLMLKEYSKEHFKTEYEQACQNTRHYEQLRSNIMAFWAQLCGFLFAAMGLSLTQIDKAPELSGLLMKAIGIFGFVMSIFVLCMEIREMDYFKELCQRCRILEAREGFAGQYWRTYVQLVKGKRGLLSRRYTMLLTYGIGASFWALVLATAICKL